MAGRLMAQPVYPQLRKESVPSALALRAKTRLARIGQIRLKCRPRHIEERDQKPSANDYARRFDGSRHGCDSS